MHVLVLLAALAAALAGGAEAHGFLSLPASRNYLQNWKYCPHCLNNNGPGFSSAGGTIAWPANSGFPACGSADPAIARPAATVLPRATYTPGATIEVKVFFGTQHGGRHVFRLCPRPDADTACFEAGGGYTLLR